LEPFDWA
jgi:hypothetical protein